MNLYRTSAIDDDGTTYKWSGTQADARADRKAMKKDIYVKVETTDVAFPTAKEPLLAWLNENATKPIKKP